MHLSGLNRQQFDAELSARLHREAARIVEAAADPMQRF